MQDTLYIDPKQKWGTRVGPFRPAACLGHIVQSGTLGWGRGTRQAEHLVPENIEILDFYFLYFFLYTFSRLVSPEDKDKR